MGFAFNIRCWTFDVRRSFFLGALCLHLFLELIGETSSWLRRRCLPALYALAAVSIVLLDRLDHLEIDRITVIGPSMGGMVAWEWAAAGTGMV